MGIDDIKAAIAAKGSEAARLRRDAELLEAEARGLSLALSILHDQQRADGGASIHSATQHSVWTRVRTRTLGRQPGALSNRWKRRLLELRDLGDTFSAEDVVRIVQAKENRLMRPSEVRRLFEKWEPHNHVKIQDEDRFSVPDEAVERFRATLPAEIDARDDEDDAQDGGEENEAPEGASELAGMIR